MDVQSLVSYLDIAFIALLALGCLIGFCRGIFKSTYNFVVFLVLLIAGWIISGLFVNVLLDANINMTFGEIYISSLRESLPNIVSEINTDFGALMVEGTEAYALVLQLFSMITKLIFMIIWLVLMFTLLKFVFWIIYLIIKPRKKDENGKKKKKKFTSRLGGALVGAIHTILLILVICIPVSGICSIGVEIDELNNQEPVTYNVIPTDDKKLIVLANENTGNSENYFGIYRQSSFGKLYGMIKLGDTSIDEKLFDDIFSFNYNANKIRLKSEFSTVINVYNRIESEIEGEITLESIMALDTKILYEIVDQISDLKLISVAIPVATEFVVNSESFKEDYADLLEGVDGKKLVEDIKNINYHDDFANLGKGFIDISKSGLLSALNEKDENGESLSIFAMLDKIDNEYFNKACEKIGDVKLLDIVGDFGIGYVLKSEAIEKYLLSANLTVNDINLNGVKLSEEISSLGNVVLRIKELGLANEKEIDITKLEDDKINKLVDALYEIKIFNQNTRLVVSIVREELLPEDYKVILPDKEMTCSDLKSVVKVAKVMLKASTTMEGETKINLSDILSKENIEMLQEEAKNSEFLSAVIDGAGEILIDTICKNFGIEKENINLDSISWVDELESFKELFDACSDLGIDFDNLSSAEIKFEEFTDEQIDKLATAVFDSSVMKNNTELILTMIKNFAGSDLEKYIPKSLINKEELISFVKLARTIVKSSSGETIDISAIDKNELSEALSGLSSENIDNLLTGIIESTGVVSKENINLPEIDPSTEAGQEEIKKTLEAMDVLSSIEDITSVKQLRDEDINTITSSSVATSVIVSVLEEQTKEGGALSGFLVMDGVGKDEWVDKDGEDGELKKLLAASEIILDDNGNANINSSTIGNLSDSDISTLTNSKVVVDSLEQNVSSILEETIKNSFNTEELGIDINLGSVEVNEGESKQEAWQKEITILRDVASMSEGINPETTDLSDKDTAEKIGNLIDSSKNSQILGDTSIQLASSLLESGYANVEGEEAPKVDANTDFAQEFSKLQSLLSK